MKKVTFFSFIALFVLLFSVSSAARAEVTFKRSGKTLNIKGDAASDSLMIESGALPNDFRLVVNGGWPVDYYSISSIKIDMGGGTDLVICQRMNINGNLSINLRGDFGDVCLCTDTTVYGNLSIEGTTDVVVYNCYVARNLTLSASHAFDGSGDGRSQAVIRSFVGRNTKINGSEFGDSLLVHDCALNSRTIKTGTGDDVIDLSFNLVGGNHSIDGGQGMDSLTETDSITGRITRRNLELIVL